MKLSQHKKNQQQKLDFIYNRGDKIYDKFKENIEKQHMVEIVAIDLVSKKPVSFGKTISDAYINAKIKVPSQTQFYFRKVGKPYLGKL